MFLDKEPATDIIGEGPEAVAQRLRSRQDFFGFDGATPGIGGLEEIGLRGATPGVVDGAGADFEAAGFRSAIVPVGAVCGVGVTTGAGDRKGEGVGLAGMTVAIGCGVSGALLPQSGSFQKGTRSRAARCLWCCSWTGCAEVQNARRSVPMRTKKRSSVLMLSIGGFMLVWFCLIFEKFVKRGV